MVGLLVASPVFAEGSKHYNAMRLIGYGLLVWSAAVVGCALAWDFRRCPAEKVHVIFYPAFVIYPHVTTRPQLG